MGRKRDKRIQEAGTAAPQLANKPVKVLREYKEQIRIFQLDDDATNISFPADLTSAERKGIHQYATQVGLKTKSVGKGKLHINTSCTFSTFFCFTS